MLSLAPQHGAFGVVGISSLQRRRKEQLCKASRGDKYLVASLGKGIKDFGKKNATALLMLGATAIGLAFPAPGQAARKWGLSQWATTGIFFVSGCSLQDGDFAKAYRAWPCGVLALVSILFITPLAGPLVLRINLIPKELVTGLAVFCCAPTTLSTGVALVQIAGANKALALALTIGSNCLGIVTMPYLISAFIGRGLGIHIPAGPLLWSMGQVVLLPLLVGKMMRDSITGFGDLIDTNRETISMMSSILLSLVPWMQMSCSRSMLLRISGTSLLLCAGLGIGLHLLFLAVNYVLFVQLSKTYDKASTRAAILVASEKTLPVCIAVVEKLNNQLGESGMLILPCILAHFLQIILDSLLVNCWIKTDAQLLQASS